MARQAQLTNTNGGGWRNDWQRGRNSTEEEKMMDEKRKTNNLLSHPYTYPTYMYDSHKAQLLLLSSDWLLNDMN